PSATSRWDRRLSASKLIWWILVMFYKSAAFPATSKSTSKVATLSASTRSGHSPNGLTSFLSNLIRPHSKRFGTKLGYSRNSDTAGSKRWNKPEFQNDNPLQIRRERVDSLHRYSKRGPRAYSATN